MRVRSTGLDVVQHRLLICGVALFAFTTSATTAQPTWRDSSPHSVQLITVDTDVRLEVLDWGGAGRPLLLLAGLGNTAHIYDDFAPKLTDSYHVYAVTRRGFGASSVPQSGYDADRLADDVLAVIDALRLLRPVVAGHSIAGEELSSLGARYSDRVGALIYFDAAYDRTDARLRKLTTMQAPQALPSAADRASYQSLSAFITRTMGVTFPESELHNTSTPTTDGSVGPPNLPGVVIAAILGGVKKPDYARIRAPALAVYATWGSASDLPGYNGDTETSRKLFEEIFALASGSQTSSIESFQEIAQSRVVRLPRAHHYVFLSSEADVLREVRAFVAGTPIIQHAGE